MYTEYPSQYTYYLYGHSIRSAWPLPYLQQVESNSIDFDLISENSPFIEDAVQEIIARFDTKDWFQYARLPDGSDFVRWTGLFDFLVSPDGQRIIGRPIAGDPLEKFQMYLLGQVLSFAMVRRGIEPLHATVIVADGQAVAFLGHPGFGKSTLAGAFLKAGFSILTDDMLVMKRVGHEYLAFPGPPRIKLFPHIAKALIGEGVQGTPMNPDTSKLIIPLDQNVVMQTAAPLKKIYILQPPDTPTGEVEICLLSQSQALLAFIQNTFNTVVKGPERLTQQFKWAAELSAHFPVKSLSYPRDLSWLPRVMDTVLKDIS